jgi:hypothetical protein
MSKSTYEQHDRGVSIIGVILIVLFLGYICNQIWPDNDEEMDKNEIYSGSRE